MEIRELDRWTCLCGVPYLSPMWPLFHQHGSTTGSGLVLSFERFIYVFIYVSTTKELTLAIKDWFQTSTTSFLGQK